MASFTDEIIEEIHATRQEHAARFGFDIDRILDDLKQLETQRNSEIWPLAKTPECPPVSENATLQKIRFSGHARSDG